MRDRLLQIAATLLPGRPMDNAVLTGGQFHDVVLLPGTAAVRVARSRSSAAELPRRTALLSRLAALDLPFRVPEPLGPVATVDGLAAVALSWVGGAAHPKGSGDPVRLRELIDGLAAVDVAALQDVLDVPHAYAGREHWEKLLLEEVLPRLPGHVRGEARRRIEAAAELPPVPPRLVHGDLAGDNVHWGPDGAVVGVLDWDLASPFDPAVDAACLAWHGWEAVAAAVDTETYRRARVWEATFVIEGVGAALLNDEPLDLPLAKAIRKLNARM
ncbi:aminoglycoside phosphotransferase family protein [Nonomuraea sp. NPDC050310]|uniref:phosphotransferase family protein n=1 Tax=unclassified Nonomuraea TaxID=2593643 RepID=UPI0033CE4909